MSSHIESKTVVFSQKQYERFLTAYPKAHREEYGPAMAQLFRDQSRDAWREARMRGLAALWLRVLPDLVKTSFLEHLSSLKGTKNMIEKISELIRSRSAPLRVFRGVFLAVFLVAVGTATLVTFILPDTYGSVARIKIERDAPDIQGLNGHPGQGAYDPYFIQTEFEVIQSENVLGKVVELLDLNTVWGRKYQNGEKLKTTECILLLKGRLALRPVDSTSFIEIRVFSEDKDEAAKIANTVAEVYMDYRQETQRRVFITGSKSLEEQAALQEKHVASAQEKLDRLRMESNVPKPEPATEELQAHYPSYSAAKQELETEVNLRKTLEMKIASEKNDAQHPRSVLVKVMSRAVPSLRPVRPNKPLNIALGMVIGAVLGLGIGGFGAWVAVRLVRKKHAATVSP